MWAEERHSRILKLLEESSRVEADSLAVEFAVSRETIRRDLKYLEAVGLLHRTHGGALSLDNIAEQPFRDRLAARKIEKQAIAEGAVRLVAPGDCCFVDAGSTTASFAFALARVARISVITNSLDVAITIRKEQASADILLLGGMLGVDVPGTYGTIAVNQLEELRADLAFVSPVGIDPDAGVSYYDFAEAELARTMMRNARRRVVLADSSKCYVVSRTVVCSCQDVDVLVSDFAEAAPFQAAGIGEVMQAGPFSQAKPA